MPFEIGQRVGDYQVVSMLGAGGMGQVYRVRNVISNRTEAMKVLLPNLVAEPDLAARFIGEIRILASFDHPNIAQLHTALQVDNQLVMVMEFVEGLSLAQRAQQGAIPQADLVNYMQQVLSALSYAHGRGVVHRDVKPANVMVTPDGTVKLMDFGIARADAEIGLTRPGTSMGSLNYMSPEQVRGGTVDARSDIYSTGVMMYELFAGRRPFQGDSDYSILSAQCNDAPQPPAEVNPGLPPALSDLILCAMAKDPANRFQNAQAVSNALRHVAAAQDPVAKAPEVPFTPVVMPGIPQSPVSPSSSHRGAWIALGAFAVLAVLAAAAVGLPRLLHTSAKVESTADQPAKPSLAAPLPSTPHACRRRTGDSSARGSRTVGPGTGKTKRHTRDPQQGRKNAQAAPARVSAGCAGECGDPARGESPSKCWAHGRRNKPGAGAEDGARCPRGCCFRQPGRLEAPAGSGWCRFTA